MPIKSVNEATPLLFPRLYMCSFQNPFASTIYYFTLVWLHIIFIIMFFSIMSGGSMHSVLVGLVCLAIASAICCSSVGSSNNIMCLESERHALLQFKQGLVDDSNVLASWKSEEKDCCKWRGIECNNQTGGLPHCFNNITALADDSGVGGLIVELVWKGIEIEFPNITGLRSIDISSNYLIGKIPQSIANMTQLISLNLSRNNLMGKLPENFGNLKMLESLDLSRNQISGKIPASFASLNFLSVLDLSYNNLSGRIPTSTQLQSFDASKYMGNHGLCGPPLTPNCSQDGATQADDNKEHDKDGLISLGFFISAVLGFVTGFWMVCGSLLLKTSWRYAYFRFLDNARDWIYVKTKAKVRRTLQR